MVKKQSRTPQNPYQSSASPAELSPANLLAYEIVGARRDLLPSVEQIMNAGLDDDVTAAALGLFQTALINPGDPHRDPRVAITRASNATGSKG